MKKVTFHYKKDRAYRAEFIRKNIGYGETIDIVEIDRGHKDGSEFHVLKDTGIIEIYNYITHKHITDLIAQPYQIIRDFGECPKNTMAKAKYHQKMGWYKI